MNRTVRLHASRPQTEHTKRSVGRAEQQCLIHSHKTCLTRHTVQHLGQGIHAISMYVVPYTALITQGRAVCIRAHTTYVRLLYGPLPMADHAINQPGSTVPLLFRTYVLLPPGTAPASLDRQQRLIYAPIHAARYRCTVRRVTDRRGVDASRW
jgi:hypothetical protein